MAAGESDKRAHLRAKRDMKPQFKEDIKDFVRLCKAKTLLFTATVVSVCLCDFE